MTDPASTSMIFLLVMVSHSLLDVIHIVYPGFLYNFSELLPMSGRGTFSAQSRCLTSSMATENDSSTVEPSGFLGCIPLSCSLIAISCSNREGLACSRSRQSLR